MKRIGILILCLVLVLPSVGCSPRDHQFYFYYPRMEFEFGSDQPVIVSESREAPGHQDDLEYLLNMYLEGPLDAALVSPFPAGTALEGFTYSDGTLYVTLNEVYADLDGLEHTIAASCMAYTCFGLTAAEKVVVNCNSDQYGNQSITLFRDSVLLYDDSTAPVETDPQQ